MVHTWQEKHLSSVETEHDAHRLDKQVLVDELKAGPAAQRERVVERRGRGARESELGADRRRGGRGDEEQRASEHMAIGR